MKILVLILAIFAFCATSSAENKAPEIDVNPAGYYTHIYITGPQAKKIYDSMSDVKSISHTEYTNLRMGKSVSCTDDPNPEVGTICHITLAGKEGELSSFVWAP